MSFSPRNVSQLIVGKTVATVNASAAAGAIAINSNPVSPAPAAGGIANKSINIYGKSATGIVVSDTVEIASITSMKEVAMVAGAAKKIVATYLAAADYAEVTYKAVITVHDNIGSMLNERFISAYVACDANGGFSKADGSYVGTPTPTLIAAELAALLSSTVAQGRDLFTATASGAALTIEGILPAQNVGVKDGLELPWEFEGGYVKNTDLAGNSYAPVPATYVETAGKVDGLVQMKNIEWFNGGYSKDVYRETGYPYSHPNDSTIVAAAVGATEKVLIIQYSKDRDATNVERQHKQLIVVGTTGAAAVKAAVNAVTS